jgi:hypothetical protein
VLADEDCLADDLSRMISASFLAMCARAVLPILPKRRQTSNATPYQMVCFYMMGWATEKNYSVTLKN